MSQERVLFNRLSQSWLEGESFGEVLSSEFVVRGPVVIDRKGYEDSVILVDNGEGVTLLARDDFRRSIPLFIGERRDSLNASMDVSKRINALRELGETDSSIFRKVDPIILLSNISELLKPDSIESSLQLNDAQLRSVFHSPFADLEYIAERVPAPRAKRISRRAVQVLAAHSEDWLKASGSGVTPRRIEALEREDFLDIYENRVAARLIDDVRRHLKRLIQEDENLDSLLQEVNGPFRKIGRLTSLWGRQTPGQQLKDAHIQRRSRIMALLGRVEEFRDSRLYSGVPRRARVSNPIRVTNLLDQDLNYRGVRRLWDEWWKTRNSRGGIEEFRSQLFSESIAFFDLTWLILGRAISGLDGYLQQPSSSDGILAFNSNWGSFRLLQLNTFDSGAWELTVDANKSQSESKSTFIVSIACQLLQGSNTDVRERLIRIVNQVDKSRFQQVVICFPGTNNDAENYKEVSELNSLLNPIASQMGDFPRNVWLVPISPIDIESTERVERVVRWIVLGGSLLNYPAKVQTSKAVCDFVEGLSVQSIIRNGNELVVTQNLNPKEKNRLETEMIQRTRMLNAQLRAAGTAEVKALDEFKVDLKMAIDRIESWSKCPICSEVGVLTGRSSNTFESKCVVCDCRWGLRHDARSNDRVPFIWLGDGLAEVPTGPKLSRWLGRDVLAEPCRHNDSEYGSELINPWTGACTAFGEFSSECIRCIK